MCCQQETMVLYLGRGNGNGSDIQVQVALMQNMKLIIAYLLAWLLVIAWLWSLDARILFPDWFAPYSQIFICSLSGAVGGIIYCLRGVYVHRAIDEKWDNDWNTWYYLRPIVSLIMGGVAYIFLKAGLLVLDAKNISAHNAYGFYALSFIAGFNVGQFLKKTGRNRKIRMGNFPLARIERKFVKR